MYFAPVFTPSKKFVVSILLVLMSLLLAAYGPMASISNAQSAIDLSKFQTLKDKALDELERRLNNYDQAVKNLKVNVELDNTKFSASVSTTGSTSSPSPSPSQTPATGTELAGLDKLIELPSTLQDKVLQFMEKIMENLTGMKDKIEGLSSSDPSSLGKMESFAKNIDTQFGINQLTQVQATVTQALESMTGVLDSLKTSLSGMQSQVTKIKECVKGIAQNGSFSASGNVSNQGASGSVSGEGCEGVNLDSEGVANQAQSQLDNISTITSTISSILLSSITLLTALVSQFGNLSGGLGSLGSLGNLANLGNLTDLGGALGGGGNLGSLSSLASSAGGISGLLGSFNAISSQLDLANGMSGNAFNNLGSLGSLLGGVGGFGL